MSRNPFPKTTETINSTALAILVKVQAVVEELPHTHDEFDGFGNGCIRCRIEAVLNPPRDNVERAGNCVVRFFLRFAAKISAAERNDFFHPMNRSSWQGEFARWLEACRGTND